MNTKHEITVDEANKIQSEWMAVVSTGPRAEIDRVCKLMKKLPQSYFSVTPDKAQAIPMIHGTPMSARPLPIAEARCYHPNIQTELAWCGGKGQWGEWVTL